MAETSTEEFPRWIWFAFGAALLGLVVVNLILQRGARGPIALRRDHDEASPA